MAATKTSKDKIAPGTEFAIYGCAGTEDDRIGIIKTTRVKLGDGLGSRNAGSEWTGETFPNTRAGFAAAEARAYELTMAGF